MVDDCEVVLVGEGHKDPKGALFIELCYRGADRGSFDRALDDTDAKLVYLRNLSVTNDTLLVRFTAYGPDGREITKAVIEAVH